MENTPGLDKEGNSISDIRRENMDGADDSRCKKGKRSVALRKRERG